MKSLVATVAFAFLLMLLLYLNASDLPRGVPGQFLYLATLLFPSLAFWGIVSLQKASLGRGPQDEFLAEAFLVIGVSLAVIIAYLMATNRVPPAGPHPIIFSLFIGSYAYSWVLGLAGLLVLGRTAQFILSNRTLGSIALGVSLSYWALDIILSVFRDRVPITLRAHGLGSVLSFLLEAIFILATVITFLSLMNENLRQNLLGLAAYLTLLAYLVFPGELQIFFALWTTGAFFWPLVIVVSLCAERILWRGARLVL